MSVPRQLPLALELPPSRAGEDFLVADCNREAVRWLDRWPDWPSPALVLHGPHGCGKTHLAHIFAGRIGGAPIDHGALAREEPFFLPAPAALVVDDADRAVEAGLEEQLLHLYNRTAERGGHLLLVGECATARWPIRLPDLRSRLLATPQAGIGAPDEALLGALLVKLFADRQLKIDDDVILYALPRIERSFAAARRLAAALDEAALGRRRLTMSLVRAVLKEQGAT
jgi:chromosomal replication initiation ATPase DnaA